MFTIFISSVQREFAKERAAIYDFIPNDPLLGRFFQVHLCENMPATNVPAERFVLKELDKADIYLGLFGNEYGFETASGLSTTEIEFKRACQLGLYRLIYIRGSDDRERHPKMEALIRKASAQLVRRRFTDTPDLLRAIYASLIPFLEERGILGQPDRLQPAGYDVFLSYSSEDAAIADDLFSLLEQRGLRCFMAKKSIKGGALWRDEIRTALRSSRSILLLLTPNSLKSKWVLCEVGAFWALMKPIIPAFMFIDLKELPELISDFQCKPAGSREERESIIDDVWNVCRS